MRRPRYEIRLELPLDGDTALVVTGSAAAPYVEHGMTHWEWRTGPNFLLERDTEARIPDAVGYDIAMMLLGVDTWQAVDRELDQMGAEYAEERHQDARDDAA